MKAKQRHIIEKAVKHCQELIDGTAALPSRSFDRLSEAVDAARAEQRADITLQSMVGKTRNREHSQALEERTAQDSFRQAKLVADKAREAYDALTKPILNAHRPIQDVHMKDATLLATAQKDYAEAEHAFRERVPGKMEYVAVLSRDLDLSSDHSPPSLRMAQRFDKVRKYPRLRHAWHALNHFSDFKLHKDLAKAFIQSSIRVGERTEAAHQSKDTLHTSEVARNAALAHPDIVKASSTLDLALGAQYQAQQRLAAVLSEHASQAHFGELEREQRLKHVVQMPAFAALVSVWMEYQLATSGKRNTSENKPLPTSSTTTDDGFYAYPHWMLLSDDLSQSAPAPATSGGWNSSHSSSDSSSSDCSSSYSSSSYSSDSSSSSDSGGSCGGGGD